MKKRRKDTRKNRRPWKKRVPVLVRKKPVIPPEMKARANLGRLKGVEALKKKKANNQRNFLAAFLICGTISHAARAAGIESACHYGWMHDLNYREKFALAQEEVADALEIEARRRAIEGVSRFKFHNGRVIKVYDAKKKKMVPYEECEKSDILMIFLLKGRRKDVFGENQSKTTKTEQEIDRAINDELARLGLGNKAEVSATTAASTDAS